MSTLVERVASEIEDHTSLSEYGATVLAQIVVGMVERDIASRNGVSVKRDSPETSKQAAWGILPKTGSIQQRMYALYVANGQVGFADHEIEQLMGLRHQSASAARKRLCDRGLLTRSGNIRKTPGGMAAEVYVPTSASQEPDAPMEETAVRTCPLCGGAASRQRGIGGWVCKNIAGHSTKLYWRSGDAA